MKHLNIDREQLPAFVRKEFLFSSSELKVAEIGVLEGDYAKIIYDSFSDAEINLIDLWQTESNDFFFSTVEGLTERAYQKVQQRFFGLNNVKLLKGNSSVVFKQFPDEYFDFIYIDADHSYEGLLKDLQNWFPKVKRGGVISGHDWDCHPDHEFYHKFGVDGALKSYFKEKIRDVMLTSENYYKSWIYQKM